MRRRSPSAAISFPGVGQVREDRRRRLRRGGSRAIPGTAVIVDINLAAPQPAGLVNGIPQPGKTASGKVGYTLNFYILKPENLANVNPALVGYGKVMYEPPNRGGKTWTALGRVSGGGNDPATITDTTVLANSFLMPKGFTMVWSGWEPLDDQCHAPFQPDRRPCRCPSPRTRMAATITGPGVRVRRRLRELELSRRTRRRTRPAAKLTHRVHLNDPEVTVDPALWNYNAGGDGADVDGGIRRERHLRVFVHRQGPGNCRARLRRCSRPQFVDQVRNGSREQPARRLRHNESTRRSRRSPDGC